MILVPGKNSFGTVLHLIVGPETEFFADIHGATIMDVTSLVKELKADERIFVSITRTRSEPVCLANMDASQIPHVSSFMKVTDTSPTVAAKDKPTSGAILNRVPVAGNQPAAKSERCSYCMGIKPLLALPGFQICSECAQIELGRKRDKHIELSIEALIAGQQGLSDIPDEEDNESTDGEAIDETGPGVV